MLQILDPRSTPPPDHNTAQVRGFTSLQDVPISVINNNKPRFDEFVTALLAELADRYGAHRGLWCDKTNAVHPAPDDWYGRIARHGGAAIAGWGDCGSCSTYSFHDARQLMARGIPAVLVISAPFVPLATALARSASARGVPWLVLPHPPTGLSEAELADLARSKAPEVAQLLALGERVATPAGGPA